MPITASDLLSSMRDGAISEQKVRALMHESDHQSIGSAPPAHFDQHIMTNGVDMSNLSDPYLDREAHSLFASYDMAVHGVRATLSSPAGRYALKLFRDDPTLSEAVLTVTCSPGSVDMRVKTMFAGGMNILESYDAASCVLVVRKDPNSQRIHLQTAFPTEPGAKSFPTNAPIGTTGMAELMFAETGKRRGETVFFNAATKIGSTKAEVDAESFPGWWTAILSGRKSL